MSEPRLLKKADIPQAMLLKQAVGWNQTAQDWERLLDLEPEGCFGIEIEGKLAATITTTCYGRELAWIGMVITAPEYRGQGLASRLMRHALEFLDRRQMRWVKLDATSMGSGLYRKFGFEDEFAVERWLRGGAGGLAVCPDKASYKPDDDLDQRAFGADRNRLLSTLARGESVSIPGSGYAMGRPGANAAYFGPCVATTSQAAQSLLEWFLSRHAHEPVYWDLLPDNVEATRLARKFRFSPSRELIRMARRGTAAQRRLTSSVQEIYAIAGFEFG